MACSPPQLKVTTFQNLCRATDPWSSTSNTICCFFFISGLCWTTVWGLTESLVWVWTESASRGHIQKSCSLVRVPYCPPKWKIEKSVQGGVLLLVCLCLVLLGCRWRFCSRTWGLATFACMLPKISGRPCIHTFSITTPLTARFNFTFCNSHSGSCVFVSISKS